LYLLEGEHLEGMTLFKNKRLFYESGIDDVIQGFFCRKVSAEVILVSLLLVTGFLFKRYKVM
jgi:hypothetical protein